jgi:tetratricopeptide (TPR) repeat protein
MHLRDELERVIRSQHSTGRILEEVDAFVENELEESGKLQIIEEMAENGDLKSEVNLIKDLNRAFTEKEIHQLRSKLAGISKGLDLPSAKSFILIPEKLRKVKRNGTYAAVFLVLVGITSVIWQNQRESKIDYEKYFIMPQTASSYRTDEDLNNTELSRGYEYFNRSDFVNALNCFNKVLVSEPRDQVIHFYAGIADRNIQHFPEALGHFQQVTEGSIIILAEQAEWYKVLCYLKMEQKDRAVLQLEAVIDRKGFYYKDALVLLGKLHEDD